MTSASVKDLNSLMTFVGVKNTPQMQNSKPEMSFGNAMQKAKSEQTQTDIGSDKTQNPKKDSISNKTRINEKAKSIEAKPNASKEKAQNVSDRQKEMISEAADDIKKDISEEMDVPMEDIEAAMETLGLTNLDLLNPQNLSGLVMELSKENDPMALVTNEELFTAVKDLTTIVDATVADLANDMDIEISEMTKALEQLQNIASDASENGVDAEKMLADLNSDKSGDISKTEMSVEANLDTKANKEAPRITVEINRGDETEEAEADEKGNIIKTVTVTSQKAVNEQNNEGQAENGNKKQSFENEVSKNESHLQENGIQIKNSYFENLVNKTNEATPIDSPAPFVSGETTKIMDQIMDYMKVNVKPEMDQIEMQLHPASLGTVKINLTANKAGEITAEFKVQNEQVKAAVEAQINDLRETFKASGNKVTEIEVQVETQGFDANLWQGKGHDSEAESGNENSRRTRRINLNGLDALFEDEASEEEILAAEVMRANGNTVDFTA